MLGLLKKRICQEGLVKVKVTVGVFIEGKNMTREFELDLPEGVTLREVFICLDEKGSFPRNFFKKMMKDPRITLIHRGQRKDVPDDLSTKLENGDEVAIISSIAGG